VPLVILLAGLGALIRVTPAHAAATYVYASPTGSGSTCSISAPCSLTGARSYVQTINSSMSDDIVVYLRGCTYTLSSTLTFSSLDSGTNGHNVIWQAYPGDPAPVLSGGVTVTGWQALTGHPGVWWANVGTDTSVWTSRQVYINGVAAQRARSTLNPSGYIKWGPTGGNGGYTCSGGGCPTSSWNFGTQGLVEVVGESYWKQMRCRVSSISGSTLTMVEPCWGNTQSAVQAPFNIGSPTYIENAFELMANPGDYYLHEANGNLYYMPRADEMSGSTFTGTVVVPKLESLISATGTLSAPLHNIQFVGLTLAYTTWRGPSSSTGYDSWQAGTFQTANPPGAPYGSGNPITLAQIPAAVTFNATQSITMKNNVLTHIGGDALWFNSGVWGNTSGTTVTANRFTDIAGGAIEVGNPTPVIAGGVYQSDSRNILDHITISSNLIDRTGYQYQDTVGIMVFFAQYMSITHNELTQMPYTAISMGWGWGSSDPTELQNNSISYNSIHDVMLRLTDGGGIYLLSSQPSSSVTNNLIADVGNMLPHGGYKIAGIYLDQGVQNFTVNSNVVARIRSHLDAGGNSAAYWLALQTCCAPTPTNNTIGSPSNYSDTSNVALPGSAPNYNQSAYYSPAYPAWPTSANPITYNAGMLPADSKLMKPDNSMARQAASVSASDYYNAGWAYPSNAVDGITTTKWQSNGSAAPHWLQVDLGVSKTVDRWIVKHAGSGGESSDDNAKSFRLQGSTDCSTFTDVDVVNYSTDDLTDRSITPTTARCLRLSISVPTQSSDVYVREYDFEVWGPFTNLALLLPSGNYSATSSYPGNSPAAAFDGDVTTKWNSAVSTNPPHYLTVDLGANHTISHWLLFNAGAGGESSAYDTKDVVLQRWDAGSSSWVNVDTVSGNTSDVMERSFAPVTAEWFTIWDGTPTQNGDYMGRIYEFQLWGN